MGGRAVPRVYSATDVVACVGAERRGTEYEAETWGQLPAAGARRTWHGRAGGQGTRYVSPPAPFLRWHRWQVVLGELLLLLRTSCLVCCMYV